VPGWICSGGPASPAGASQDRTDSRCPVASALDLLTDTIWVLAGPAVYVDLVDRRHWPSAQYATWLTDQLDHATQLARHAAPAQRR
jgi:hypothetical protein